MAICALLSHVLLFSKSMLVHFVKFGLKPTKTSSIRHANQNLFDSTTNNQSGCCARLPHRTSISKKSRRKENGKVVHFAKLCCDLNFSAVSFFLRDFSSTFPPSQLHGQQYLSMRSIGTSISAFLK